MDITLSVGDTEIGDSTICVLGSICEMVQLTGGYFSKVGWFETAVDLKVFERVRSSSEIGSSQPRFLRHRSCSNAFAGRVNGAANPNGS